MPDNALSAEQRAAIEWECQKLSLRFSAAVDAQDYDALADILSPDAAFARPTDPDRLIQGRDAIIEQFKARPSDKITRHLLTNIIVDALSADAARGTLYATLFTGDADDTAGHGIKAGPKQFIGTFHDDYVRTRDGWRLSKRTGHITFTVE